MLDNYLIDICQNCLHKIKSKIIAFQIKKSINYGKKIMNLSVQKVESRNQN